MECWMRRQTVYLHVTTYQYKDSWDTKSIIDQNAAYAKKSIKKSWLKCTVYHGHAAC